MPIPFGGVFQTGGSGLQVQSNFIGTDSLGLAQIPNGRTGILRRRVYDSLPLSRLIANGQAGDRFDARILGDLPHVGIGPRLDAAQFAHLRHFGVFRQDCEWRDGRIRAPDVIAATTWACACLKDPRGLMRGGTLCRGIRSAAAEAQTLQVERIAVDALRPPGSPRISQPVPLALVVVEAQNTARAEPARYEKNR